MADPPVINPVDAINRKVPEGFRTLKALHTALRKMGFYNINLKSESRQRAYRHAVVAAQLEIGPWTDVPALMKEMLTPLVPRYHLQGAGRNFSDQWVVSADVPELQVELKVKIALAKPRPRVKE